VTAQEAIAALEAAGGRIRLQAETAKVKLPLDPQEADRLLAELRQRTREVVAILRDRQTKANGRSATCSPDCYAVEPSVWIHRPHTGCTTIKREAGGSPCKIAVTCRHCQGEKRCGCIACSQGGPGVCATCKGTGRVMRWVQ